MAKTKMNWDWVNDYPIFVYTTFIDYNIFNVKIVKGIKGDSQAGNTGPDATAFITYQSKNIANKDDVVAQALKAAKQIIEHESEYAKIDAENAEIKDV